MTSSTQKVWGSSVILRNSSGRFLHGLPLKCNKCIETPLEISIYKSLQQKVTKSYAEILSMFQRNEKDTEHAIFKLQCSTTNYSFSKKVCFRLCLSIVAFFEYSDTLKQWILHSIYTELPWDIARYIHLKFQLKDFSMYIPRNIKRFPPATTNI
jgi:hypothetical protein